MNRSRMSPSARLVAAIIVVMAALVAVAPASAMTRFKAWGYPGPVTGYGMLPFHDCRPAGDNNQQALLSTGWMTVGASSSYVLPQTIKRLTLVQYSVDDGRNWYDWRWLDGGTGTATTNAGVRFFSQDVRLFKDLYNVYSYRLIDVFEFRTAGGALVGQAWWMYNGWDEYYYSNPTLGVNTVHISAPAYYPGCKIF